MPAPLALNVVENGRADAPAVAVLHGLFGSAGNWGGVARRLAERYRVLALDARNHGASPWADEMDYAAMAADVEAALAARGIGSFALVGHSMGGKTAMMLALTRPQLVGKLVVVDIAPVAYQPRVTAYASAMRTLDLAAIARRADADAALAAAVPDAGERQFLLQNLVARDGGFAWRLNLPVIEAAMPALAGFPDLPADSRYDGPVLFISGARSDYVRAEHGERIGALFPRARFAQVAGAGHWVHAEQPAGFLALLEPFLAT